MYRKLFQTLANSIFIKYWLPVFLWVGAIYYFSNQPELATSFSPVLDLILRKLAHITEFGILAILLARVFSRRFGDGLLWFLVLFISFFYAVFDEVHQSYIPGRYGSIRDMLIDFNGAFLGIIAWHLNKLRKKRKKR